LVGELETTYFNAYISCIYDQSTNNDINCTFRFESLTNLLCLPQNEFIIGLLLSSEFPVKLNGPWIYGAKFGDNYKLGEDCEVLISLGICHAQWSGTNQDAKNLIATITKKFNKNSTKLSN